MPSSGKDPQQTRLIILLVAASTGMMIMGFAMVLVFMAADSEKPKPPQPAPMPALAEPPPQEAPVPAPTPSPLEGGGRGYGRPEPLFPTGAPDGERDPSDGAPLFLEPGGRPEPVQGAESRPIDVQGLRGSVEQGSLPGRFGEPYAPIRLVVFNDFQCPFCSRLEPTFAALHERYPQQLEIHFRDFPLEIHAQARGAHMAARCAHDQGRFWAMHDLLFANQRALETERLLGYAAELGLDPGRFEPCLREEHHAAAIDADIAAGRAAGVRGTPATFVNGTLLSGAQPVEKFIELIEAAR
jgi:predicted DsbA family dithiol-disulfide isomerase